MMKICHNPSMLDQYIFKPEFWVDIQTVDVRFMLCCCKLTMELHPWYYCGRQPDARATTFLDQGITSTDTYTKHKYIFRTDRRSIQNKVKQQ